MQMWKLTPDMAPLEDSFGSLVPDRMSTTEAPKLSFLYTVKFFFRQNAPETHLGSDEMSEMAFGAKSATRPNPTFTLVDVNYSNFRTKVQTKVDYGTVSVVFYDDAANKALNIFKHYLNAVSPISNASISSVDSLDTQGQSTSASTGPLTSNRHGVISRLRVSHHYIKSGQPKVIHYDYFNPHAATFNLDELDRTQSNANTISMTFAYDGVKMTEE